MLPIVFQPGLPEREQLLAHECVDTVMQAADPRRAMLAHLRHLPNDQPTHILAFGKASIAMTHGAMEHLGDRFARATVLAPESLVLESQFKNKLVATYPCDHPLPTQRNIDATRELIEHARSIPEDHRVLVLISGGASAMLCSPKPRVSLGEIRQVTQGMLKRGAAIGEINTVRTQLETLKGGGLAHELAQVQQRFVFLLSDVIGNDPSVIASGPMHDAHPPSSTHIIIASNDTAIDALVAWCARSEISCTRIKRGVIDEAAQTGQSLARSLIVADEKAPYAVIMGGEPTVNAEKSDGVGGPMLELGLSAACELTNAQFDWTVLTLTSDGMDGPSAAAGLVMTGSMLSSSTKREEARLALARHDSGTMCDTLGAKITTGPSGTNVNDVAIAIRWPDLTESESDV